MSDRDNYHGSGKKDSKDQYYRSTWAKTPTSDYGGEPSYLSADVFNLLISEMNANKNNLTNKTSKIMSDQKVRPNVSIPGYVGSGTKYSAADWNNVCNQIAVLISDTKGALANSVYRSSGISVDETNRHIRQMNGLINVSESEAYALRYGSGEVLSGAKTLTRLINIVRRARIHCTCHIEIYERCNHCGAYKCRRDRYGCGRDR